jgi:putative ABC transport system ATP-binding protein
MIEVKNITKSYGVGDSETKVLKGISFTIHDGEFVAIMGPSGSGKSTLMHILGCLDTPTSGTYFLDGQDVSSFSDDELSEVRSQKIGFVFQSFNLLARTTVMRNVTLPLVYSSLPENEYESRARAALISAGLPENRWDHKSNELSGGQIQRVAIARSLVNNPTVIMADEPTGNLDSKTGDIVMGTFQKLNEEKASTIVLITHEPDIALHADRIIHIKDGVIIEDKKNTKRRMISKDITNDNT